MTKFIEVHDSSGAPLLVGLSHAVLIYPQADAAVIETDIESNDPILLRESYEEVRTMIASAQGGIPMEGSKMY